METNNINDLRLSNFIVVYYLIEAINMTIKQCLPITDQLWELLSNFFMFLLATLLLVSIRPVLKRTFKSFIFIEIFVAGLFFCSFLQGNAAEMLLLKTAFRSLAVSIPIAFYVIAVRDKQILYNTLLKGSYYLIIILGFVFFENFGRDNYYSMSTSYAILLPCLFQLNEFLNKKKVINLIFFTFSGLVIILMGARGPLLGLIMYFILRFFLTKFTLNKTIASLVGFILIILFVLNINVVQAQVMQFIQTYDIHSRTLKGFASNTITQTSGRNTLWAYYFELIGEKPLFGWGLYGGWISEGSGPHNMLVGYLLAFGYIFGGIICFLSICLIFRVFFVENEILKQLILLFCARNISLYVSAGEFLTNVNWLIFVALCIISFKIKTSNPNQTIRVPPS